MNLRSLGRSPLQITPIGLGCWQFAAGLSKLFWTPVSQQQIDDIVAAALKGGVNWFDTAEAYGSGASEDALSAALQHGGRKPGDVVVATKWLPVFRTAASIEKTFPVRERHLAPFPVDLLQIHQPNALSSFEKQGAALVRLLKAHKVKAVGVSNFNAAQMRRIHKVLADEGLVLASNQVFYSLNRRRIETDGTMEAAKELGITIIAYSPLGQGVLTGRFHQDPGSIKKLPIARRFYNGGLGAKALARTAPVVHALQEIGKAYKASAAQVALNWLVHFHGDTVVAIPGASKVKQVEELTGSLSFTLTPDEMKRLDESSRQLQ